MARWRIWRVEGSGEVEDVANGGYGEWRIWRKRTRWS